MFRIFTDTLYTYRKKKNFRYTKIDNQKGELQANLRIKTELQKWTHSY